MARSRALVSQLAWLVIGTALLLLAGCGKDGAEAGGLDPAQPGSLAVTIAGLPPTGSASVTVTGPAGFQRTITHTETIGGLAPGSYLLAAATVAVAPDVYGPVADSVRVTLPPGPAVASVQIGYSILTGRLIISVDGVPAGAADLTVSGPGGFQQHLTAGDSLEGLKPGDYAVVSAPVDLDGDLFGPAVDSAVVSVVASTIPAAAAVAYSAKTGRLDLAITGLPAGAGAAASLTGPNGFTAPATGSTLFKKLAPGSYTLTAADVTVAGNTYVASPKQQTVSVAAGSTVTAALGYTVSANGLNLLIDGMYLTQAAQKYDGSVPLVAGRDGYLRVFVWANQANVAAPSVRVRLYSGGALIQTTTVPAPGPAVPTTINERVFAASWNLLIPGTLIQPGLSVLAEVDPGESVAETADDDNSFPASGIPFAVDVRTVPTWKVRLVPVRQQANGLQGNVTGANLAQFLDQPLKLLPVAGYDADIRAVYTTTAGPLQAGDGNDAWGTVLSEISALRTAEGSDRYYFGVVKTGYGSGVAGIGYVGGGVRAALGWDALPSASEVMAHEVGHNMGRMHSPCGGAANTDPSYPYSGGGIGIYGLDVATATVKSPATFKDLMGYCDPTWVSDYTWSRIIAYRQTNPAYAPSSPIPAASGLLVWGRISAAGAVLEPAFRVAPPMTAPAGSGQYRVEGFAADGRRLFSFPIELVTTMTRDPRAGHQRHFASVLPLAAGQDRDLASLRLVGPGILVERRSVQAVARPDRRLFLSDPGLVVSRPAARQSRLIWDAATYPVAMVRDRATGAILSFARGGRATIWTAGPDLDVLFSDGVRSVARTLR